jgi:hypothetical protein
MMKFSLIQLMSSDTQTLSSQVAAMGFDFVGSFWTLNVQVLLKRARFAYSTSGEEGDKVLCIA